MSRSNNYDGSVPEYWKSTYITSTGKIQFSVYIGAANKTITGGTTIAINTTYHVVHTYDGANLKTYLNGVSDATAVAQTGNIDAQGTTMYRVGRLMGVTTENQQKTPGAGATGQGGFGSGGTWTGTSNITTSDNNYATASVAAAGASEYIYAGDFGFNIPTGAVITNYNIQYEWKSSITALTAPYIYLRPTYNSTTGQSVGLNSGTVSIPTSDTNTALGGVASAWSISLTPAQINSSNFGVALRVVDASGFGPYTISIDRVQITISYYIPITMDEAAVFNAAKTAPEIADHYQTGTTGISVNTASINKQIIGADGTSDFAFGGATVTSLPSSPANGQECYYLADSTNGVVWHLKYRSASGSSYKWEYVGGAPLTARSDPNRSTTSTTYVAPATDPMSITIPLAGDYDISIEGAMYQTTTHLSNQFQSYTIGATAASDAWANNIGVTAHKSVASNTTRQTGIAASSAVNERIRIENAGSGTLNVASRRMRIVPVRVG